MSSLEIVMCLKEPEWNWQNVSNTFIILSLKTCVLYLRWQQYWCFFFPWNANKIALCLPFKETTTCFQIYWTSEGNHITFSADARNCWILSSAKLTIKKRKHKKSRSYCQWIILDYASILFECFFRIKTFHPFPGSHFSTNGLHVTSCRNLDFILLV